MKKIETNNGKKGGWLKGKPHYDKNGNPAGGIKAIVTDTGRPVELEGGEVIINKEASAKHWKELSRINQSAGNGVAIGPPSSNFDEDPEEYKEGGRVIEFNANHTPNKWILEYAKKIKKDHPEIWKLGGNIFGNQAFENLKRVSERGYWLDSEKWMYIKWRSYVARHQRDYRIEGVVAMLKWVDKVGKGWSYMKNLIEDKIAKIEGKKEKKEGWAHKMAKGGRAYGRTPAPKKDRVFGSKVNKPGSAASKSSAKSIKLDDSVIESIKNKIKGTGISLATAKAVVRRGMGAYSSSHRPTISGGKPNSRVAWGLARLNAFIYKKDHGVSKSGKYNQDDDLMESGGLVAPNGKPSNLTPEQYRLVRTPEFKAWFGDWENDPENASKVVDENGEPLVVYHGTKKVFTSFYEKQYIGSEHEALNFFTTSYKTSVDDYDGWITYPCYLKIVHPLRDLIGTPESSITFEKNKGLKTDGFIFSYGVLEKPKTDRETWLAVPKSSQIKLASQPIIKTKNKKIIEKANKLFFDADGNTTFNANNPDIRYADGGELSKGIKTEQEHRKTLEKIASGKLTVGQAIERTAKDHLKEDPKYYTKLLEMESKMEFGGKLEIGLEGKLLGRPVKDVKIVSISDKIITYIDKNSGKKIGLYKDKFIEKFNVSSESPKTDLSQKAKELIKPVSSEKPEVEYKVGDYLTISGTNFNRVKITKIGKNIITFEDNNGKKYSFSTGTINKSIASGEIEILPKSGVSKKIEEPEKATQEVSPINIKPITQRPTPVQNTLARLDEWINVNMKDVIPMSEEMRVKKALADLALSMSIPTKSDVRDKSKVIFDVINKI